jgi:hypothetical protein
LKLHGLILLKAVFGLVVPAGVPEAVIKLILDVAALAEHFPGRGHSQMVALTCFQSFQRLIEYDRVQVEEGKARRRPYAQATAILNAMDGPQALASAAIHDQPDVLRVLDGLIGQLAVIRKLVTEQDETKLVDYLLAAGDGQAKWLAERSQGDWANRELARVVGEAPRPPGFAERVFGIRGKPKKK